MWQGTLHVQKATPAGVVDKAMKGNYLCEECSHEEHKIWMDGQDRTIQAIRVGAESIAIFFGAVAVRSG